MTFLEPIAFVFALSLPIIVLFYLLKRKRKTVLVSSTLLWERFVLETRASTPFQKLRRHWLMILQLLLLSLVILALGRPFLKGATIETSRLFILILDGTASMQATDVRPTRFDQAKRQVREFIESMHPGEQATLILVGHRTEVVQSPSSNKPALLAALARCTPSDAEGQLDEALRLAKGMVEGRPRGTTEIHLFSDGVLGDLSRWEAEALPIKYHPCGAKANNQGIIAVQFQRSVSDPDIGTLFLRLVNTSSEPVSRRLEIMDQSRRMLTMRLVQLPAQADIAFTTDLPVPREGVLSVRLSGSDDLRLDDEVWIPVNPAGNLQVLLLTQRTNQFLVRALQASPRVELYQAAELASSIEPDILVLDTVRPSSWPDLPVLAVQVSRTNWLSVLGTVDNPTIVDWRVTHPLLRYVRFDDVWIRKALRIKPAPEAVPVVESQETALILAGESSGRRWVWLGFDPLESTWPLRISFPIFIANCIGWLDPTRDLIEKAVHPAGRPIIIPLRSGIRSVTVRRPSGEVQHILVDPSAGQLVVGDTGRCGVYEIEMAGRTLRFGVNLLSAQESNLAPQPTLKLGRFLTIEPEKAKAQGREIWRWFVLAAMVLLLIEWWYFQTRTV